VGRAFLKSYQLKPVYAYVVAIGMAAITGLVVIGGLKRIGKFCERLVPLMSMIYILGGLIIIAVNIGKVPQILVDIFSHALGLKSFAGGAAGTALLLAIKEGVAKGMFSSEAGQGSAPMAHAAAVTKHPFEQGVWGAFEVFIDTIIICTITALVVLSSGQLEKGETGIDLVISSFATVFPSNLAGILVTFSILTFCLTTQIGFYVYYETSVVDIFGKKPLPFFKWFYLLPGIAFAGIENVEQIWVFANITVGVAALPNLIAILFLSGAFFKLMRDYMQKQNHYDTAKIDGSSNWVKKANNG
jgi:AGCS family alanine or glycine:cation symporter